MIRFLKQKPVKIGIYYPISLALAMLACFWFIGTRDILVSALASRPYAVLVEAHHFFGLLTEKYENAPSGGPEYKRIISMGDSNFLFPPDGSIPLSENSQFHLSEMILESLKARGVEQLPKMSNWSYGGATIFDRYCLLYEAEKFSPDLLLIPVNWISLGEPWMNNSFFFRPELSALVPFRSELPKDYVDPIRSADISAIKHLEHKINLYTIYPIGAKTWLTDSFRSLLGGHVDAKTEETSVSPESIAEEEATPQKPDEVGGRGTSMFPVNPQMVKMEFPMEIGASHSTLADIRAVSYLASRHKIRILFFIWPVNSGYLSSLDVFDEEAFEKSKALIQKEIENDHTYFADLSSLLGHEDFYDWRGHCTIEGRRKIAEALTPKVLEILELETPEKNGYAGAENSDTAPASGS